MPATHSARKQIACPSIKLIPSNGRVERRSHDSFMKTSIRSISSRSPWASSDTIPSRGSCMPEARTYCTTGFQGCLSNQAASSRRETCVMTSQPPSSSLSIPDDASLVYLAEGAANIVYKIDVSQRAAPGRDAAVLKGVLLRLRKELPTTQSAVFIHEAFVKLISPLFPPECIFAQKLVSLPPRLVPRLNSLLDGYSRPANRRFEHLADDGYALLITDMTPPPGHRLVEFKPKWLTQSPTAPKNATRCRTCALKARRSSLKLKTAANHNLKSGYCPLDLISPSCENVKRAGLQAMSASGSETGTERRLIENFCSYLRSSRILELLQKYQRAFDGSDALFRRNLSHEESQKLMLAYTLRDCSLFVIVPEASCAESKSFVAKLGDLDMKSELKIEKWRQTEKELIDGGWYTGSEDVGCSLGRKS